LKEKIISGFLIVFYLQIFLLKKQSKNARGLYGEGREVIKPSSKRNSEQQSESASAGGEVLPKIK
jgi:hypothetical protein